MSTIKDAIIMRLKETIQEQYAELADLRMKLENVHHQLRGPTAPQLDCVSYLTIKLHADGGLQVSGNIGDQTHALSMLEHAKDSVRTHHASRSHLVAPDGNPMVNVPNRDVDVAPSTFSTRPFGDMQPGERGDLPPA